MITELAACRCCYARAIIIAIDRFDYTRVAIRINSLLRVKGAFERLT